MAELGGDVVFQGIVELNRALRKVDPDLRKDFARGLKGVAAKVADDARGRVPQRSGRAAGSIRAGSTAKGPYVAGGKKTVPYYGWLDFGSREPISGRPRSVGPWSGTGAGPAKGRFIYPAIDDNRREIEEAAADLFETTMRGLLAK